MQTQPHTTTHTTTAARFLVMESCEKMPSQCWGRYRRVAVVEVDPAVLAAEGRDVPHRIDERARGLVRIVDQWRKCGYGRIGGPRSGYGRAMAEAQDLAARLNAGEAA